MKLNIPTKPTGSSPSIFVTPAPRPKSKQPSMSPEQKLANERTQKILMEERTRSLRSLDLAQLPPPTIDDEPSAHQIQKSIRNSAWISTHMRSVRTKKLEEVVDGLRLSLSEPGDHDILAEIVTGLQDLVDNLLPHLATVHVQTWARPVRRAIILLETNENQRKWKITIEKINGELNEKFINRIIATLVFIKLVAVSRPSFASGQASRIAQNWVLDQMGPNAKSEVFRSIEASLKRRRKRKNVVANTLVFGFVLLWLFWSIGGFGFSRDIYWSFFGLNESSTIQEYKYSSLKDRVRFLGNLCTKTACLEAVDLHCGFGVGDDGREFSEFQDVVESCFYAKLKTAPPDTMLGDLVLQCGRKNAQFTNVKNDVFNPTSCKENGGRWGVIKPMASN